MELMHSSFRVDLIRLVLVCCNLVVSPFHFTQLTAHSAQGPAPALKFCSLACGQMTQINKHLGTQPPCCLHLLANRRVTWQVAVALWQLQTNCKQRSKQLPNMRPALQLLVECAARRITCSCVITQIMARLCSECCSLNLIEQNIATTPGNIY